MDYTTQKAGATAAKIADFIREVPPGNENAIELSRETLEDGGKVTVVALQNRILQPEDPTEPELARSPRRAHVLHDAEGLVAYLEKYKTDNTVILADAVAEVVTAIIDEKAAKGFELVTFRPQRHPLFTPWLNMLGAWMPLRKAIDFLLDNRRVIIEPDGKQLARDLSQIKVSKKVEMMQGVGTHSINGVMVETAIEGKKGTSPIELPDEITIEAPMYVGCQAVPLIMDVSIESSTEHGVLIRMASPDILTKAGEQFDQFLRAIKAGLGGDCTVALGSAGHQDWKVLR